ncbi:hypothetical protein [Roseovarius sp.]|jgi:hypothetical protein|uniref:hypothetical protein n=1 Tax=Roseovarius sp. TaxID=1486281 RepID=UPI002612E5D0|nr:hypothetical protein [Roseovarius sp.]MDM8168809.1 hypothetical protein [Roseovarius sp.]
MDDSDSIRIVGIRDIGKISPFRPRKQFFPSEISVAEIAAEKGPNCGATQFRPFLATFAP